MLEIKTIKNRVRTKRGTILYTVELKDGKTVLLSSLLVLVAGDKVYGTVSDPQDRDGIPVPMFIMVSKDANADTMSYQDAKTIAAVNMQTSNLSLQADQFLQAANGDDKKLDLMVKLMGFTKS